MLKLIKIGIGIVLFSAIFSKPFSGNSFACKGYDGEPQDGVLVSYNMPMP